MNKTMKWSWLKVPVKVEQINEYLFKDTVPIWVKIKKAVNDVKMNDCENDYKMNWQAKVNTGDIRPSIV